MNHRPYRAGFEFVTSTPTSLSLRGDRKRIRGHARKAGTRHERVTQATGDQSASSASSTSTSTSSTTSSASPSCFGSSFDGLDLPPGVEPTMIPGLVKLLEINSAGVYPYEVCFNVHVTQRAWFPEMVSDVCCLHALLFSAQAFLDAVPYDQLTRRATFHYLRTLQLLQGRIDDSHQLSLVTSDTTIMVVTTLAGAAEIVGDGETVEKHVKGLMQIVRLRGGIKGLSQHKNMQVKVCRADLTYAIHAGSRPLLYRGGSTLPILFEDNRHAVQCQHGLCGARLRQYLTSDTSYCLAQVYNDVHAFSCLSNLAYQSKRQMTASMHNSTMVSVMYRLAHLHCEGRPMQEVLRLGLLLYATTLFMKRQLMGMPFYRLQNAFETATGTIYSGHSQEVPLALELWLAMLPFLDSATVIPSDHDRLRFLRTVLDDPSIVSWSNARDLLKSVAWVDFLHDKIGQAAYIAATEALQP